MLTSLLIEPETINLGQYLMVARDRKPHIPGKLLAHASCPFYPRIHITSRLYTICTIIEFTLILKVYNICHDYHMYQ